MLLLPARWLNPAIPNLGFGGKTVGFGPILRAGSAVGRTPTVGLLLVTVVPAGGWGPSIVVVVGLDGICGTGTANGVTDAEVGRRAARFIGVELLLT